MGDAINRELPLARSGRPQFAHIARLDGLIIIIGLLILTTTDRPVGIAWRYPWMMQPPQ
jgi:hypothetical protein